MKQIILSLNGIDGVGKTTQSRLLRRRAGNTVADAGRLSDHDPRWNTIDDHEGQWWFGTSTIEQLTDLLANSYLARHKAAHAIDSPAVILDRGIPMLEASLAATIAVRKDLSDDDALQLAKELLRPWQSRLGEVETCEIQHLLLHGTDPEPNFNVAVTRQETITATYTAYLSRLSQILHTQWQRGRYQHSLSTENKAIIEVQTQLRQTLKQSGLIIPNPWEKPIDIVALAGLSESGKSTAGDLLSRRHGFARLKMGYLTDTSASRHNLTSPYEEPVSVQAELLTDEMDRWLSAHHYQSRVSIESLNSHDLAQHLKTILGSHLRRVYLEASTIARGTRSAMPDDTYARDEIKRARGAHHIASIAEVAIDNNHSQAHLNMRIAALVNRSQRRFRPQLVPVSDLTLPKAERETLTAWVSEFTDTAQGGGIDMIAVTGSVARNEFRHWWSDIDLLMVGQQSAHNRVADALQTLRTQLHPRKVGITFASPAEITIGLIPSQLIHTLRQLEAGTIGAQWLAPQAHLVSPANESDREASWADTPHTANSLKRALIDSAEVRVVYKLTALLAKKILKANGHRIDTDEVALREFFRPYTGESKTRDLPKARTTRNDCRSLAYEALEIWAGLLTEGEDQ